MHAFVLVDTFFRCEHTSNRKLRFIVLRNSVNIENDISKGGNNNGQQI